MKQQPDQLFQQKLESLNMAPSAAAWDNIEKNLDRKAYPVWLWKVAAGLLLVSVVGVALLTQQSSNEPSVAMREPTETSPNVASEQIPPAAGDTLTTVSSTPEVKPKNPKAKTEKRQQKPVKPLKIAEPLLAVTEVEQPAEVNTQTISESVMAETDVPATAAVTPTASTAIVYSVEEVNQKFLLTNTPAQATNDEKKPSTFQKLLAKVQDLKTNEDPMGKLRQKKNEILALNFNKEKREQNN